jgi:hypothetical protein
MIALGAALISAFAVISQTLAARRLGPKVIGADSRVRSPERPRGRVAPGATTASVLDNSVAVTSLELAPE